MSLASIWEQKDSKLERVVSDPDERSSCQSGRTISQASGQEQTNKQTNKQQHNQFTRPQETTRSRDNTSPTYLSLQVLQSQT